MFALNASTTEPDLIMHHENEVFLELLKTLQ
jgi:hypothetical protein